MDDLIENLRHEFGRHKFLCDRALATLDDQQFFRRPENHVNSAAIVVKHLAGSFISRWTDFYSSDGEKPDRMREQEFHITESDTRSMLLENWNFAWQQLFDVLDNTPDSNLNSMVTIRGETHTVLQALLRGLTHAAYHAGQILYIARLRQPDGEWLTIKPGESASHTGKYLQRRW